MTSLPRSLALCALLCLTCGCIFLSEEAPGQQPGPEDSAPDVAPEDAPDDLPTDQPDAPADLPADEVPDQPELCVDALFQCGADCVDLSTSAEHCGACDRSCGSGLCVDSACVCPDGASGRPIRPIDPAGKPPMLRLLPFFHSEQARANDPASVHYLAATLVDRTILVDGLNALGALVEGQSSSFEIPTPTAGVMRAPVAMEAVALPDGALFAVVMRAQTIATFADELFFVRLIVNPRTNTARWERVNVARDVNDASLRGIFGGIQLTLTREGIVLAARIQEVVVAQGGHLEPQHLQIAILALSGANSLEVRASYRSGTLNPTLSNSQMLYDAQYPLRLHVEEGDDASTLGVTFCQEQSDNRCDVTSHLFELRGEGDSLSIIDTKTFVSGLSHSAGSLATKIAYGLGEAEDWSFFAYYSTREGAKLALQTVDGDPLAVSDTPALSAVALTAQKTSDLTAGDLEMGWLQSDDAGGARGYHASWRFLNEIDAPLPETLGARLLTREGELSQLQSASAALPGSVLYVAIDDNAQIKSWSVIDGQSACEPLTAWPARLPTDAPSE